MTIYLGKSCSFCLPRVPFVNCRQFMYLVISLLVLRAGYGIWLYQFLIIAYLFYFKTFLLLNRIAGTFKLNMQHWVLEYYRICSNDTPGLTLTYLTARSNLVLYAFVWKKVKTMDFSETIVVCNIKVGTHLPITRMWNRDQYRKSIRGVSGFIVEESKCTPSLEFSELFSLERFYLNYKMLFCHI